MLKIRIIPTLLWKDVGLVKGKQFDSWRRVGSILPSVKVYNTRQVDELILVDITATKDQRPPDLDTIKEISPECFVPLTVGGGIQTINHVKNLLRAGADKVSINSASYRNMELVSEAAKLFGSQCIVASIDVKKTQSGYECYASSGTQPTGRKPEEWAEEMEKLGAGEILLTSIDHDGMMNGYNIDLIKRVTERVTIPVIASGGASSYEDLYQAIKKADASAVAAASIFHFTEQTPLEAKKYLAEKKIPVRLPMVE